MKTEVTTAAELERLARLIDDGQLGSIGCLQVAAHLRDYATLKQRHEGAGSGGECEIVAWRVCGKYNTGWQEADKEAGLLLADVKSLVANTPGTRIEYAYSAAAPKPDESDT